MRRFRWEMDILPMSRGALDKFFHLPPSPIPAVAEQMAIYFPLPGPSRHVQKPFAGVDCALGLDISIICSENRLVPVTPVASKRSALRVRCVCALTIVCVRGRAVRE
jgi:hypothetical protein